MEEKILLKRLAMASEVKKFEPKIIEIFEEVYNDYSPNIDRNVKTFDDFEELFEEVQREAVYGFIYQYFQDIFNAEDERIKHRLLSDLTV